jgi:hypothetical protein
MSYDWTLFLTEEFHPTFQKEISRQLFEKGKVGTGLKNFENINVQLIIGMNDVNLRVFEKKVFAKVDFITPGSFSIPIDIFWTTENKVNLLEVHKNDVSDINIKINWCENFPLEEILPYMNEIE